MKAFKASLQSSRIKLDSWGRFFIRCLTLAMSMVLVSWCQDLHAENFYRDPDVKKCLVDIGVTYSEDPLIEKVRSKPRCAARCLQDSGCSKFLYCRHTEQNCFRIKVFGAYNDEEKRTNCDCYIRVEVLPCQNGGALDESGSCQCLRGFYGSLCENVIQDCSDGYKKGNGILSNKDRDSAYIRPVGSTIFPVLCYNPWGGYTYIQHRTGQVLNFNRSWEEYRHGFGDIYGDYWLGLDQIHFLTVRKHKLEITFQDYDDVFYTVYYNPFSVKGVSTNFTIDMGTFTSHQSRPYSDDSFMPPTDQNIKGCSFSTYDHNPSGSSCPTDMRSGWWFTSSCTAANLNGPFITQDECNNNMSQPRITWLKKGCIQYVAMRVTVD